MAASTLSNPTADELQAICGLVESENSLGEFCPGKSEDTDKKKFNYETIYSYCQIKKETLILTAINFKV